jgi:hypothetical protein
MPDPDIMVRLDGGMEPTVGRRELPETSMMHREHDGGHGGPPTISPVEEGMATGRRWPARRLGDRSGTVRG